MTDNKCSAKTSITIGALSLFTGLVIGGGLQQLEYIKQQPPKQKPSLNKLQRVKKRILQRGERQYTACVLLRNDIKHNALINARKAKEQPSQSR